MAFAPAAGKIAEVGYDAAAVAVAKVGKLARQLLVAIPGGCPQRQGILARQDFRNRVSPGRVEILLAGLARAQRGVQGIEDGRLAGVQRLGSLALFLKIDQHFVSVRSGDVADRNNGAVPNPLLRQPVAKGIDRRGARKAHVDNRTTFKINAIE